MPRRRRLLLMQETGENAQHCIAAPKTPRLSPGEPPHSLSFPLRGKRRGAPIGAHRHPAPLPPRSARHLPRRGRHCPGLLLGEKPGVTSAGQTKTPPEKTGGASRVSRAGSIITCTNGQVGRLSSVSLLPTSGRAGRPAIRRFKSASLIRDVGLMSRKPQRANTHSAGIKGCFRRGPLRAEGEGRSLPSFMLCAGTGAYSSSSSSSKSRTMKCSYTSCSCSSSSMDSNSSSPFSSSTDRRITIP